MNNIDTRIAIGRMATSIGARSQSESHPDKPTVKKAATKSGPVNTQLNPIQIEVSFSFYGSHNERVAIVVKNEETGDVIRELPSKEMQKLHAYLDMRA